jgi:hypothetical protein
LADFPRLRELVKILRGEAKKPDAEAPGLFEDRQS